MAKPTGPKLDWITIDIASLPVPIAKQYARYTEAHKEMKAERDALETALAALTPVPAGKRMVFGYNWGNLSFALDDAKPTKAAKSISLGEYIKAMSVSGQRV